MKNTFQKIAFFVVILITNLQAQSDWQLAKEKDGIKVYLRNYKGGKLKELRAICTIKSSLHAVNAVMKDVPNAKNWINKIDESILLKQMPDGTLYKYFVIAVPFPLKNRDVIYHEHSVQEKSDKSLIFSSTSIPDYQPEKDGLVRMIDTQGSWKFTPKGNGELDVVYQLYADPAGIPVWVVNMMMVDGPIATIGNLRNQVLKEPYKSKKYTYIHE